MTEKIKAITKDRIVPLSISIIVAVLVGVATGAWTLASEVSHFRNEQAWMKKMIEKIEEKSWSIHMERESWMEYKTENPQSKAPDVSRIHSEHR